VVASEVPVETKKEELQTLPTELGPSLIKTLLEWSTI
jgi:hypothetical protein